MNQNSKRKVYIGVVVLLRILVALGMHVESISADKSPIVHVQHD
jgi:hypothetical protein